MLYLDGATVPLEYKSGLTAWEITWHVQRLVAPYHCIDWLEALTPFLVGTELSLIAVLPLLDQVLPISQFFQVPFFHPTIQFTDNFVCVSFITHSTVAPCHNLIYFLPMAGTL